MSKQKGNVSKKVIADQDVKSNLGQPAAAEHVESSAPAVQEQDFEKHPKFAKFKKQGDN